MKKWLKAVGAAVLLAAVADVAGVTGGTASTTAAQKNCSFQLRIGDVLPFTGGLAAYGANFAKVSGKSMITYPAGLPLTSRPASVS